MKSVQKVLSVLLAGALAVSAAACGETSSSSTAGAASSKTDAGSSDTDNFAEMKLGETNKNIKADLKVISNRTDRVKDGTFDKYVKDFQKMYPNVTIKFEGLTNYSDDIKTRMQTKNWGDICMIPDSVQASELSEHFVELGDVSTLQKTYNFTTKKAYDGKAYGLANFGNVSGVLYNKKVFKDAGVTTTPKTPTEFVDALKKIRAKNGDKVDPLYTNFKDKWPMGAWDDYMGISATGDADYFNQKFAEQKDPFAKSTFKDGTGPYAVYNMLYQISKEKLTEKDPSTSDWEGSKAKIANGQIGAMVLGSWAYNQCKEKATDKATNNLGYMAFPITVDGKQYASMGGDYCYGININSDKDKQTASKLFIKYLVEKSGYWKTEGSISTLKSDPLPENLDELKQANVTILEDSLAKSGKEDELDNVSKTDSELSIRSSDGTRVQSIVEAGIKGNKTFDDIAKEWNQKWSDAQKKENITAK